jgi:hypothetical protein
VLLVNLEADRIKTARRTLRKAFRDQKKAIDAVGPVLGGLHEQYVMWKMNHGP